MDRKRQRKLEKKRTRQKKRKAREVARTRSASEPLAYHGGKYRTADLVEVHCSAETGILEAFVASDRQLTDHAVEAALKRLVMEMRRNIQDETDSRNGTMEDFIIWRIRQGWEELFRTRPHPGRDNLVGVLRSILGSIEFRKSAGNQSRSYLTYIEEFLAELGISVEQGRASDFAETSERFRAPEFHLFSQT